jgi:hypothetical protein
VSDLLHAHVLALEDERCRCIVEQRFDRLREMLSERLVHTHTRGNVDGRDGYLAYISGVVESLEPDGQWLMIAFQATPLGAPPPAVPRP